LNRAKSCVIQYFEKCILNTLNRNPDKELLQNVAIFSKTCSTEFEKNVGMRAIVNIVFLLANFEKRVLTRDLPRARYLETF
jgi:hypothetical protein